MVPLGQFAAGRVHQLRRLARIGRFRPDQYTPEAFILRDHWYVHANSRKHRLPCPLSKNHVAYFDSVPPVGAVGLSMSAESVQKRPSIRRSNSRDKRYYLHRSSSRRNRDNSSRPGSFKTKTDCLSRSSSYKGSRADRRNSTHSRSNSFKLKYEAVSRSNSFKSTNELCSCPNSKSNADNKENEGTDVVSDHAGEGNSNDNAIGGLQTIHVTLTYKPRI